MNAALPLGATSYGYVHHLTLEEALGDLADAGYTLVELAACLRTSICPT